MKSFGQALSIANSDASTDPANSAYAIQQGDTLASIAAQFDVTTSAITQANPGDPMLSIGMLPAVGSFLVIPSPLIPPSPALAIFGLTLLLLPKNVKMVAYVAIAMYAYQMYQSYLAGGSAQIKTDLQADESQGIVQGAVSAL